MNFLNEAIRSKDFTSSQLLITKYLRSKLGNKVYPYPVPEVFTPAGGVKHVGVRFFIMDGTAKSVRLNWKTVGKIGSQGLVSIDYWDGSKTPQPIPSHHVKLDHETSLVKILPLVVELVHNGLEKSGMFMNEAVQLQHIPMITDFTAVAALNEASYSSGEIGKTISNVINALKQGVSPSDQYKAGGPKHYGPGWAKVIEAIKSKYPSVLQKQGVKFHVDTSAASKIDAAKLMAALGSDDDVVSYTTANGSKEEIEVEGTSEADIERLTYEEQLESLQTGMKLLMANATNQLYVQGRGGCLAGKTEVNTTAGVTTLDSIKTTVAEKYGKLEIGTFYNIEDLKISIETKDGFKPVKSFVVKTGRTTTVLFDSGAEIECSSEHIFMAKEGKVFARDLQVGTEIETGLSTTKVSSVVTSDEAEFYDMEVDSAEHTYLTANGINHHNTGKTQNVEDELHAAGKKDGDGYMKITGSASTAGI